MLAAMLLGIAGCRDAATSNPVAIKTAPAEPRKTPEEEEREVQKSLALLSPQDRKLVEEQRYCPIMGTRLGTATDSGEIRKVTLNDEQFFVCCHDCEENARLQPARTLARVKELREKNRASTARAATEKAKRSSGSAP
jgi:hypothetical protein